MAQVWYYIPAGNSPETFDGPIWKVVVKDKGGTFLVCNGSSAKRSSVERQKLLCKCF